jgi:hypothetical protein
MKMFKFIFPLLLLTASFDSNCQIKKRYIFKDISLGLSYVQNKNLDNGKIDYSVVYSVINEKYSKDLDDLIVIIFKSKKDLNEFSKDLKSAISSMKPYLDEDIFWQRDLYSITLLKSFSNSNPILAIGKPNQVVENFHRLSKGDAMKLLLQINRIDFGNPLLNPEL